MTSFSSKWIFSHSTWYKFCRSRQGNEDQAFKWLDTADQERDFNLIGLKTDFLLDPLHSDPRFAELVHKVGLPQ
jgi:hypothetical protein